MLRISAPYPSYSEYNVKLGLLPCRNVRVLVNELQYCCIYPYHTYSIYSTRTKNPSECSIHKYVQYHSYRRASRSNQVSTITTILESVFRNPLQPQTEYFTFHHVESCGLNLESDCGSATPTQPHSSIPCLYPFEKVCTSTAGAASICSNVTSARTRAVRPQSSMIGIPFAVAWLYFTAPGSFPRSR